MMKNEMNEGEWKWLEVVLHWDILINFPFPPSKFLIDFSKEFFFSSSSLSLSLHGIVLKQKASCENDGIWDDSDDDDKNAEMLF